VRGGDTDLLSPLQIVVSPTLHLKKEKVSVSETLCSLALFRLLDGGQNLKPINPEEKIPSFQILPLAHVIRNISREILNSTETSKNFVIVVKDESPSNLVQKML
jgi:hypothetical protein